MLAPDRAAATAAAAATTTAAAAAVPIKARPLPGHRPAAVPCTERTPLLVGCGRLAAGATAPALHRQPRLPPTQTMEAARGAGVSETGTCTNGSSANAASSAAGADANDAFLAILEEVRLAMNMGIRPVLIRQGSSGSYFVKNTRGVRRAIGGASGRPGDWP